MSIKRRKMWFIRKNSKGGRAENTMKDTTGGNGSEQTLIPFINPTEFHSHFPSYFLIKSERVPLTKSFWQVYSGKHKPHSYDPKFSIPALNVLNGDPLQHSTRKSVCKHLLFQKASQVCC